MARKRKVFVGLEVSTTAKFSDLREIAWAALIKGELGSLDQDAGVEVLDVTVEGC